MTRLNTTRRGFLAGTAAIGAAGYLPGFTNVALAQRSVLNIRADNNPDILDPGYMSGAFEVEVQKQVLPILADHVTDEEGNFDWQPSWFAKSLEWVDETHIAFELEDHLEWSGGYGPVLASDVKYSFERMKGTDWSGYFDAMDHVEVTGDRTGVIVLNQPFAPFIMTTLGHGASVILCEAAMKEVGEKFTTEIPAICGPYTYKITPGQRVEFELNPDWRGPEPAFPRVVAHIITEAKAAELGFEAGEIDVTELSADSLARYQQKMPPQSKITVAGALQYMWLGMNTEHPKLQDINVRRAIQHAVSVDDILQGAYGGATEKSYGIICPGLIGERNETKYYTYDPEKARELLAEAGVDNLSLTLRTLNTQERILTAQIIQANLQQIGIKVEILPLDSGPFWELGVESAGDTWKDLELWLMRFGTQPDPYEAAQWFVSEQVGVWNWERWTSEEYDRLYEEGLATTDEERRNEIYLRMQDIMEETGAYVWINHEPETFIHRDDIVIRASPSAELNYHLFEQG